MRKIVSIVLIIVVTFFCFAVFSSCSNRSEQSGGLPASRPADSARTQAAGLERVVVCSGDFIDVMKPYGYLYCDYSIYKFKREGKPLYEAVASVTFVTGDICITNGEEGFRKFDLLKGYFSFGLNSPQTVTVDMYPMNSYNEPLNTSSSFVPQYYTSKHPLNIHLAGWNYKYLYATRMGHSMCLEHWFVLSDEGEEPSSFVLEFRYSTVVKRGFLTREISNTQQFECLL